jgi:hypothetical protein
MDETIPGQSNTKKQEAGIGNVVLVLVCLLPVSLYRCGPAAAASFAASLAILYPPASSGGSKSFE